MVSPTKNVHYTGKRIIILSEIIKEGWSIDLPSFYVAYAGFLILQT